MVQTRCEQSGPRTSHFIHVLSVALFALFLAGCEDRETARARNENLLPPGCKIIELDYGDLRAAVVCDKRKSTTSLRSWETTTYVTTTVNGITTMTPVTTRYAAISALIEVE